MSFAKDDLIDAGLTLAMASGEVSNFCDHVEHNEEADIGAVRDAAATLRRVGVGLSHAADRDPVDLYADRLEKIERRNVLFSSDSFDGAALARAAGDWRALQLIQVKHDRAYHSDVVGLHKLDQLRHYSLHLAKLAGATATVATVATGAASEADWLNRRVPDMVLFGLKLSTVVGERLPADAVSALPTPRALQNVA